MIEIVYMLPTLMAIIISGNLAFRPAPSMVKSGTRAFSRLMIAILIWSAAYLAELSSISLEAKMIWAKIQYFGIPYVVPLWFLFLMAYTGYAKRFKPWHIAAIMTLPTLTVVFAWTNDLHHLLWTKYTLTSQQGFMVLDLGHGPWFWLHTAFSYALVALGLFALARMVRRSPELRGAQAALLVIAGIMPWLGNLTYVAGSGPISSLDLTVLGFSLSGLLFFWAVRKNLLDLFPAANKLIVETLPDSVLVFDHHDNLMAFNPMAKAILALQSSEDLGKNIEAIFAKYPQVLGQIPTNAQNAEMTVSFNKDMPFHLYAKPIINKRGQNLGRVIMLRDIGDRVRYEAAIRSHNQKLTVINHDLEGALDEAKAAHEMKNKFISSTSHELRTPLTNIILYLSLLEKRPENASGYIDTLRRETKRLLYLVEDLLFISRLEQNAIPLNLQNVSMNNLLQDIILDRQPLVEQQVITLETDIAADLPLINADLPLLDRVISNLLINAANYTPQGGRILIQATHRTSRTALGESPWVVVSIQDSGPGIPHEERGQIFDRFYRGKQALSQNIPGTGLGLAISKEILDLHQGRIEVADSTWEHGARFTIWLPADLTLSYDSPIATMSDSRPDRISAT